MSRFLRLGFALAGLSVVSTIVAVTPPVEAGEKNGDLELARQLENAFVRVAAEASASVVVITTKQTITLDERDDDEEGDGNPFEGTPFERFYHRGLPFDHPKEMDSQGSGVVIRREGYVLTNNHVVDKASDIKVRLQDGLKFPAKVIGVDNRTDVAVLKVEASDLPAARIADSDKVRAGQWAIAIGAPYELEYSFTVGFVSATGRSAVWSHGGSAYEDYIQTDASINPGNSGGPLCNIEGQVIGINTLIRGLNRGIGFAIPINMAMEVAGQLIDKGKIVRPWIGIQIESLAENEDLTEVIPGVKDGVVVRSIYPNTPAATSDLKPADIIVAVDGVAVKTPRDLQKQVLRKKVGDKLALKVYRDGKPVTVALQTGELPDTPRLAAHPLPPGQASSVLGLTVQTLTPELAKRFEAGDVKGVVITEVEADSQAEELGLERGDIITEVNRVAIAGVEQFQAAVAKSDPVKGVLIYYRREGSSAFVVLKAKP